MNYILYYQLTNRIRKRRLLTRMLTNHRLILQLLIQYLPPKVFYLPLNQLQYLLPLSLVYSITILSEISQHLFLHPTLLDPMTHLLNYLSVIIIKVNLMSQTCWTSNNSLMLYKFCIYIIYISTLYIF